VLLNSSHHFRYMYRIFLQYHDFEIVVLVVLCVGVGVCVFYILLPFLSFTQPKDLLCELVPVC
jgi:hypothetical protein